MEIMVGDKWKIFPDKMRAWWQKRSDEQLIRMNSKQEQSISILQNRYGYTREQAASEFKKHYSRARLG
jgi:hypothetical protein